MEDIAYQLTNLNDKFERFLIVAEKLLEQREMKPAPKRGPQKMETNTASIDCYEGQIIVKCPPVVEFRNKLKEHGGSWVPALRAWTFLQKNKGEIAWEEIQTCFKDWTLIDKRVKVENVDNEDEGVIAT